MPTEAEWRPMKSAPKDGTQILTCYAGADEVELVKWVDWKPGWHNGDFTYDPDAFEWWTLPPKAPT